MPQPSSPTIKEFRVRAVRVPMAEQHRTASGVVAESPLVLTDVVTDSGVVGHSIVFTYTPLALKPTAELIRNFETLAKGDELAPSEIEQKLAKRFRLLGPQGLVGIALAAIDMALWDALARVHALPLARLLGGAARPLRAYGAVGYDGVDGCAKVAERWAARGFTGIKAKIGYPTVQEDVAVVRAMRKAAGAGVSIMVDYNQCLTPTEAIERLRVLDDEGLTWVEEPTLAHDYAGHARIARAVRTPIQCGENWWGTLDLQHALDADASDLVMPDVMKIGGVTGWLRAAALAQAKASRFPATCGPNSAPGSCAARRRPIGWSTRTGGTRSSRRRCASRTAWRSSMTRSAPAWRGMKTRCGSLRYERVSRSSSASVASTAHSATAQSRFASASASSNRCRS